MPIPDWERYRGVIKRLYLIENRTQDEVREILKREYGFTVSSVLLIISFIHITVKQVF